jgi:hypothetical protein
MKSNSEIISTRDHFGWYQHVILEHDVIYALSPPHYLAACHKDNQKTYPNKYTYGHSCLAGNGECNDVSVPM